MNYNKKFLHLLKFQKIYLLSLGFLILIVPLISNYIRGNPIITGAESYFLLNLIPYSPTLFSLVPITLGIVSLLLFFYLAKYIKLSETFTFFFILFLIFTPAYIYTFTTLSGYSMFIFLTLLGLTLLFSKYQFLAFIPLILATFIDLYSSIILLCLITLYLIKTKKSPFHYLIPALLVISTILQYFFKQALILGPFHYQKPLPDLISDLGGLNGVSLFIIILAIIGVSLTWKRKGDSAAYWFLLLLIPGYIISTQTIFYLSILITFFATVGFILTFERDWAVPILKNFTLFLLLISIIFSSITFMQRLNQAPNSGDVEALTWIKDNTGGDDIVFSEPQNGPYIKYFAQREPFYSLPENNQYKLDLAHSILESTYTKETFPILNDGQIKIIYITPQMKSAMPADQGLLFLLKNEKFKLVYEQNEYEVWSYKNDN
jgi:hypothetical protein